MMNVGRIAIKGFAGFLKFKAGRPKPVYAGFYATHRCNLRCNFCDFWKFNTPELSTREALIIIDKICRLGVLFFGFTGGEPLLREDLTRLAKRASSHGCVVSVNTNGTLIDKIRASELASVFDAVVVSIDGPEKVHDRLRGRAGTYKKAVNAIKFLKNEGLKVGVSSVITPSNIRYLPQHIEELYTLVDFVQLQPIHPYPPPPQNRPSPEEVSWLLDYLLKFKRRDPRFIALPTDYIKGFKPYFDGELPKICHAGELYIGVDPMGRLQACPALVDIPLGNLLVQPAEEILRNKTQSENWGKVTSCSGCWMECTSAVSMLMDKPIGRGLPLMTLGWK